MIAKAARLIKQLNELVEELHNIENPELTKKKSQLSAINNSIQRLEIEGLPIPKDLIKLKEKHDFEKKKFDDPEEILEYIKDQLKLTIKKIDRVDSIVLEKREKNGRSKIKGNLNYSDSITKKEWMEIPQPEKKRYKMEYNDGVITLIDIFGNTHRCKTIKTLTRHERGEGHKRERS
jgi:type IV secretory pathway VirB4 component